MGSSGNKRLQRALYGASPSATEGKAVNSHISQTEDN